MAKRSAAAHIRQLTRRHDTLAARVGTGRGQSETWDRAELAALEWALPVLKERSPAFGGEAPSDAELLRRVAMDYGTACDDPEHCDCSMATALRRVGLAERAPSPGAQLRPVDGSDEDEPEGACLDDPDGQHHVGCGCP